MAEAAKQFFVGFIHPRTWLAAIIGIVAAVVTGLLLVGTLTSVIGTVYTQITGGTIPSGFLEATATPIFFAMITVYTALLGGGYQPLLVLLVGSVVAGLIFGLTAKKERVASKSIIGGLNIGVIYIAVVLVVYLFWISTWSGFTSLFQQVLAALTSALWVDIVVAFLIVWWVSAIISMIVLSAKHD
jgi:hypothetical protein